MTTINIPKQSKISQAAPWEEDRYEIVHGKRVELPPMSIFASLVANLLLREFFAWTKNQKIGRAIGEALFRLPLGEEEVSRKPDIAFVSYDRWARDKPIPKEEAAWDVVPDVAVEVISPTDRAEDILQKVEEYLQAGVKQVWVVYPILELVHVYESLTKIRGLTNKDELDGGNVLPDFRVKLGELFAEASSSL